MRLAAPAAALLALGGCIFADYVDLETYEEDGAIWFDDPNRSWFTSSCVRWISVTEYGEGEDAAQIVWEASAATSECIADFPLRYGVLTGPHETSRYVPPRELQPGRRYEIEVELSNGAGSGSFEIAEDGTISNSG